MINLSLPILVLLVLLLTTITFFVGWLTGKRRESTSIATIIRNVQEHVQQQLIDGKRLDITLPSSPPAALSPLYTLIKQMGEAYQDSIQAHARGAEEMAMLNLVAETINRTLDLQEVFDTSLREALKTVNWDMGAIYMWDERIDALNMVSYVGLSVEVLREQFSLDLGEGITGKAAKSGEMVVEENVHTSRDTEKVIEGLPATQISIPLVTAPGQLLGVLNVGNSRLKSPTESELRLLKTVAHQMALAIDKAQLYTQASLRADELEGIVEARTEQLAQAINDLSLALEKAKEADKLKTLLLSTVSHELRTPLATIKGNTSLLIEYLDKINPDDLIEHLQDIDAETDKLTDLISDLLEMSRIQAGMLHIDPQPINLLSVLESTVNAARIRLGSRTLRLDLPDHLPPCYADARRVEQIVANLTDNAAKYSEETKPIVVQVQHNDSELIVSVTDEGKGIKPEHAQHIFDRFYQINSSRDAGRDGIGLGLAICHGLVTAHGGRIWVESVVGEGSIFSFSLPVATSTVLSETG